MYMSIQLELRLTAACSMRAICAIHSERSDTRCPSAQQPTGWHIRLFPNSWLRAYVTAIQALNQEFGNNLMCHPVDELRNYNTSFYGNSVNRLRSPIIFVHLSEEGKQWLHDFHRPLSLEDRGRRFFPSLLRCCPAPALRSSGNRQGCQMAKFDPFLSLDFAPTPSTQRSIAEP